MSTNYLQFLQSKAEEARAVFFVFERQYSSNPHHVYAFFEGKEDVDFYRPVLATNSEISKRGLFVKVCKGKGALLRVYELIRQKYGTIPNDIYLMDKDFDEFLGIDFNLDNSFFVSCEYSIESYVCCEESFKFFVEKYIGLYDGEPLFEELKDKFISQCSRLEKLLSPVVVCSLAQYEDFGNRPNFQNSNINKHLMVSSDGVVYRRRPGWLAKYLSEIGVDASQYDRARIRNLIQRVRTFGLRALIRGKYLIWFFTKFMQYCCDYVRGRSSAAGVKLSPKVQISSAAACQLVDASLLLPRRFFEFIDARTAAFS
ncbi:MAG: DUF4435 domain-containing protein [Rhodospirillales bacterium]